MESIPPDLADKHDVALRLKELRLAGLEVAEDMPAVRVPYSHVVLMCRIGYVKTGITSRWHLKLYATDSGGVLMAGALLLHDSFQDFEEMWDLLMKIVRRDKWWHDRSVAWWFRLLED